MGRRDGLVSSNSLVDDFPDVNDPIQLLKSKIRKKGPFVHTPLAPLHASSWASTSTISTTRTNNPTTINPIFLSQLKTHCPRGKDGNARIPLDKVSDKVFDDETLHNIKDGFTTLASDARLNDNAITKQAIVSYVGSLVSKSWFGLDFGDVMVKMGRIGVKTGLTGEIRKK
ncbi:peroxidase 43-like [Actinidia eriantha]|uniref:peroxidase 43-like n=1 Tax=Actinidia eriantha TaxID=165200 RepID=UPI00258FBA4C|nr:peroxidase 43-like [Actinidia eriantha]